MKFKVIHEEEGGNTKFKIYETSTLSEFSDMLVLKIQTKDRAEELCSKLSAAIQDHDYKEDPSLIEQPLSEEVQ